MEATSSGLWLPERLQAWVSSLPWCSGVGDGVKRGQSQPDSRTGGEVQPYNTGDDAHYRGGG